MQQVGITADERSQNNFSITLMPGSNSHIQINGYGYDTRFSTIKKPTAKPKFKTSMTQAAETEVGAGDELNTLSQRYYLAFLSHIFAG